MSLGETIFKLRTQRNMSQEALASELGVSRQSVSKWETDTSTPELDKLVKMSEIFNVTLDDLVFDGGNPSEKGSTKKQQSELRRSGNTHAIIGTILLCFGFLIFLLITLLGDALAGLLFSLPLLLCSIVCFFVKRFTALWCLWAIYVSADLYLHYTTGMLGYNVFRASFYAFSAPVAIIIAWSMVIVFTALVISTVLCYMRKVTSLSPKNIAFAVCMWVLFFLSRFLLLPFGYISASFAEIIAWRIVFYTVNFLRSAILVFSTVYMFRLIYTYRMSVKKN